MFKILCKKTTVKVRSEENASGATNLIHKTSHFPNTMVSSGYLQETWWDMGQEEEEEVSCPGMVGGGLVSGGCGAIHLGLGWQLRHRTNGGNNF